MKAVICTKPFEMMVGTFANAIPGPGEVLVKVPPPAFVLVTNIFTLVKVHIAFIRLSRATKLPAGLLA